MITKRKVSIIDPHLIEASEFDVKRPGGPSSFKIKNMREELLSEVNKPTEKSSFRTIQIIKVEREDEETTEVKEDVNNKKLSNNTKSSL